MKKIIYQIIRYGFLTAFIILSLALIIASLMPGKTSSAQSDAVGDAVSDTLDKILSEKTTTINPTSVTITNTTKVVSVYDKMTFQAEVLPSNATNKALVWTTDNIDIATIKGNVVTFKKEGIVTIYATVKDTIISDQIRIEVKKVEVTGVEIVNILNELTVDTTITLRHKIIPSNATNKKVIWTSSNPEIATISNSGQVKCLKEGQVTFTITTSNGINDDVTLNVVNLVADAIMIIELYYQDKKINEVGNPDSFVPLPIILYEGDTGDLTTITSPVNPQNNYLEWSTTNAKVITVTSMGRIRALNEGTAYIHISSIYDHITVIQEVIVKSRIAEFRIKDNNHEISLTAGCGKQLVIIPEKMPNSYDITYCSSNEDIVTIAEDGYMIAKKSGLTTIKVICTSSDGTIVEKETTIKVARQPFSSRFEQFKFWIRKGLGHFGAFLILAIMAGASILFFVKKKCLWMISSVTYGFVIASLTEIIQRFVPGRSGLFKDVMIDFSGYIVGTACLFGIYYLVILIIYLVKKHKRKEVPHELSE